MSLVGVDVTVTGVGGLLLPVDNYPPMNSKIDSTPDLGVASVGRKPWC